MPSFVHVDDVGSEAVPMLHAYTGMSAAALEAAINTDTARGLVIEGFGLGNLPGGLVGPIREFIARGVVVVVSTRVQQGGTWPVYGGPGSGTELAAAGVLGAGSLSTGKARLLLLACLAGEGSRNAAKTFQQAVEVLGRGNERRSPS
jgi:L-asparaginase